ncbi:type II toxin-antitoxin system RelE family toxin [Dyadobacter sp. OTU695]|uniref:type II toxin-antitoxin system RelE family toxin n=1 Tax=Dyadobacter sp. OTU695 TaxID=3043860 RepID=UPI00313BD673
MENPYQSGCKKLKGYQDRYRIRAGNYRIIYRILDAELAIDIVQTGNRKEVYD